MSDSRPPSGKTPWFDEATETPMLAEYARKLDSFCGAIADGRVTTAELVAQEERLVALMRELEPLLSPEAHEKVTQLLCEVTAYDLMQTLHTAGKARPKAKFRG